MRFAPGTRFTSGRLGALSIGSLIDEENLVTELRCGNAAAQREFWKARRPEVYAVCAHVLGTGADAEDVADEVLIDFVFLHVRRLKNPRVVGSYLRVMAVRRAIKFRQTRSRFSELVGDHVDGDSGNVEQQVVIRTALPKLERCLAVLTPKARRVLRLRFELELTNEHIGHLVGGSKQYIGRLLKRSLELLKGCMDSAEPVRTARGPRQVE
jgi:RNA polymerase sigma factor (sigma-70 family)